MGVKTVSILACVLVALLGTGAYPSNCHNHPTSNCHYRVCPNGYSTAKAGSHRCFQLVTKQMGWQDALDYCKKDGGTLASVHGYQEYQFLLSMVKKTQGISAYSWIGLNDLDQEGSFVWTDRSDTEWFWSKSARAQQWGEEDCVALNSYTGAEGFDDITCSSGCTFICMRAAVV
ncbi:C-type lectin LmsL-like [Esox lucius]|uniref:C-type lectin domain-containing protein n=1 Tax=Esox lucius TaxID=8010 RepID=A0AAY5K9Y1_ESOLU|nr:C-type lectin LmsL-like [Esox lucius]